MGTQYNNEMVRLSMRIVHDKIDSLDRQADLAQGVDTETYKILRDEQKQLRVAVKTIMIHIDEY